MRGCESLIERGRFAAGERGKDAVERGNYTEAVGSLSEAVQAHPQYADLRNYLGLALHFTGQSQEALDQFQEALTINPRYTEVHVNRALVLSDLGRLDEARVAFEQAAETEGRPQGGRLPRAARARLANLHAELGDLYSANGLTVEAADEYRNALVLEPGYHDIRTKLARTYLEGGRATLAASEFGKVLVDKADDLPALLGLGLAHHRRGDVELARVAWERCRELDPEDPAVKIYLERVAVVEAPAPRTGPPRAE